MAGSANGAADTIECDLLVIGSGGGALTAAVTARKAGLDVVVVEKQPVFGGTTATSGGMLWIPGNRHSAALQERLGETDTLDNARKYIIEEAGNYADIDRIDAYLKYGPEMIAFLEDNSHVRFDAAEYPDYNMDHPNAAKVRSLIAREYNAGKLGKHLRELKSELPQMLFFGFAIGSSVEMKQFFRAGRSPKAFAAVAGKMARHVVDTALHGAPRRVVRGRALITRLAQTLFELKVPILLSSPARELIVTDGGVRGAVVDTPNGARRILARRGVVLGSGGFPHDDKRRQQAYPANAYDGVRRSVANPGNTGDGARLAEQAGGVFSKEVSNAGAWMPTSVRPDVAGPAGVWPHLVDRLKPGFIAVGADARRFGNESAAYSAFVPMMLEAGAKQPMAFAWLIGDKRAVDKWGIGRVRPKPMPRRGFIRSGYLIEAPTLADLARKIGLDPEQLQQTVMRFNADARRGVDSEFNRGANAYDAYQGDDDYDGPNLCLGPLEKGPFYAIKMFPGEIGTFAGIRTDRYARVVREDGSPLDGLYAVGNDQLNVFGGAYPGAGATLGPGLTFGYVAARHAAGLIGEEAR
ncbi:FAD-dependent oxidoreductase [Sphingomonas jatrophae]|uniref:Succinate dehydrogenase/fumarate reductase, flavoprotein subunit n=1 Tax=Sphingomonas jatrophae TaxID=1166337 RepID=A0A1I6M3T3_9SPHN|nr:FAD-dependent oxidoreductase [Sphingomonas jatrophae]SFS10313.1 Succinate dehydrogenase/fumarate reductase, flavoprotein subunit [Sphingomonas jatrophae]